MLWSLLLSTSSSSVEVVSLSELVGPLLLLLQQSRDMQAFVAMRENEVADDEMELKISRFLV